MNPMTFQPELLDQLQGYEKPEDLLGEGGILKQLTKALVERCLEAEMKTHLETQETQASSSKPANRRNGHSKKTIKGSATPSTGLAETQGSINRANG
jgi:putative transposase